MTQWKRTCFLAVPACIKIKSWVFGESVSGASDAALDQIASCPRFPQAYPSQGQAGRAALVHLEQNTGGRHGLTILDSFSFLRICGTDAYWIIPC